MTSSAGGTSPAPGSNAGPPHDDSRGRLWSEVGKKAEHGKSARSESGDVTPLGLAGVSPRYVSTGHLVYATDGAVRAVPFDATSLEVTGSPVTLIDGVAMTVNGAAEFSISDGRLVCALSATGGLSSLLWVDRAGGEEPGIQAGVVDGSALCCMFRHAIRAHATPTYLSSDNDPLYRFHQWHANLRVLRVTEVKSVPSVPLSHPFIERLIGTLRRECVDRMLFWSAADLDQKLSTFQDFYNLHRAHASFEGRTPVQTRKDVATLDRYRWDEHCRGLYQTPVAA